MAEPLDDFLAQLGRHIRRMGAQSVITSQTVADRFGLHTTDLECLDLICQRKDPTAGELAKATGLTSGAVTALIDRLEKAGYVERIADPNDRPRVHVRIKPHAMKPIDAVNAAMQAKMIELWSTFGERDLRVIADFISRSTDVEIACADTISRHPPKPPVKRRAARAGRIASARVGVNRSGG